MALILTVLSKCSKSYSFEPTLITFCFIVKNSWKLFLKKKKRRKRKEKKKKKKKKTEVERRRKKVEAY